MFSWLFHGRIINLLAFLAFRAFLQIEMTAFHTHSYTSTSKIPTL